MSRINLTIDLEDKSKFISEYNKKTLNRELKEYILNELVGYDTNDKLKIRINVSYNLSEEDKKEYIKVLKKDFKENYIDLRYDAKMNYIKSVILILIGILFLIVGFVFLNNNDSLMSEISNIGGWLLIWESGYAIIYTLADRRKEMQRYKQIINSEIEFNK
ncbi:MAG: hypothetical protein ACI33S_06955 [Bacilli bacterium]